MIVYLLKRLGWLLIILLCAVTITFMLSRIIPADPARLAAGLNAKPEQVETLRKKMGLDKPVLEQYVDYIKGVLHFDFGDSLQTRGPVINDLKSTFPATMELILISFILFTIISVALGVAWAYWPNGFFARFCDVLTTFCTSAPVFWIGLLLQLCFANWLKLLPVAGRISNGIPIKTVTGMYLLDSLLTLNFKAFGDALSYIILPVITIVISRISAVTRVTKSTVSEELKKDYVKTLRGKGLSEKRIVLKHVLKNSLNPVVSMLGLQFGWLFAGTVMVEVIFSWPGMGLYLYNAFRTFDYNPIMAITIIVTIVFVVVNTVVDLIYPLLDPRIDVK